MKGELFMTGRERVTASLNFQKPDRIPRDLWALPYICLFKKTELDSLITQLPMDIGLSEICLNFTNDQLKLVESVGGYKDDWGSIWYVGEPGVWGEVKKPVLDDYTKLGSFKPPYHLIEKRNKDASLPFKEEYSHTPLTLAENIPWGCQRLIIATGQNNAMPIASEVRTKAGQLGVVLFEMKTPDAIPILNTANLEDTNAILHLTC